MDDHIVKSLVAALRGMPPDAPVLVRVGDTLRPVSLIRCQDEIKQIKNGLEDHAKDLKAIPKELGEDISIVNKNGRLNMLDIEDLKKVLLNQKKTNSSQCR
jgi:hypothetical protein